MLDESQLPPSFWADAVVSATALRNITATPQTGGRIPIEILTCRRPDVRHLRVFGCEAWVHVPKDLRKKLQAKARRCIVLRSLSYGKYRVWDIDARKT